MLFYKGKKNKKHTFQTLRDYQNSNILSYNVFRL